MKRALPLLAVAACVDGPASGNEGQVYGALLERDGAWDGVEVLDHTRAFDLSEVAPVTVDEGAYLALLEVLPEVGPVAEPTGVDVEIAWVSEATYAAASTPYDESVRYVRFFSRVGFDGDHAAVVYGSNDLAELFSLQRDGGRWGVAWSELLWIVD